MWFVLTMIHFSVSCLCSRLCSLNYTNYYRAVVARVRLNQLDAMAYKAAFEAIFTCVKERHPSFSVGRTLKAIIADWSDTQLCGLKLAVGDETANKVVKGCQVCLSVVICVVQYQICMVRFQGSLPTFCEEG